MPWPVAAQEASRRARLRLGTNNRWTVLQAIRSCQEANGWAPTYRELQATTGFSLSTLNKHVRELEDAGFLVPCEGRRIRLARSA